MSAAHAEKCRNGERPPACRSQLGAHRRDDSRLGILYRSVFPCRRAGPQLFALVEAPSITFPLERAEQRPTNSRTPGSVLPTSRRPGSGKCGGVGAVGSTSWGQRRGDAMVGVGREFLGTDPDALFLDSRYERHPRDFVDVLWWISKSHEAIPAHGRKVRATGGPDPVAPRTVEYGRPRVK